MKPVLVTLMVLATVFFFSGGCNEASDTPEGTAVSRLKTGFVDVRETKLYYEEMGQGPPLVMIHGGLLDRRMWDPQFEAFAAAYRVVRYDVRNHGSSRGVPGEFTDIDDLLGLLDQLNIDRAAVVGLSLGARIAIDFAIAHPGRVDALVLASPGASGYEFKGEAVTSNTEQMNRAAGEGDLQAAVEYFQRSWTDGPRRVPSEVDPSVREAVRVMAMDTVQGYNIESITTELDPPAIGRLAEIRAPTLAIVGDLDMPGVLEIADTVEKSVAGAEVIVLSEVAHMVNLERPEEFNAIVLAYLAKTIGE